MKIDKITSLHLRTVALLPFKIAELKTFEFNLFIQKFDGNFESLYREPKLFRS